MSSPFVVLVEGSDDQEVCRHLLRQHGLEKIVVVEKPESDGYSNLLSSVPVRIEKGSDLEVLAIVVDADIDIKSRWQSLRDTVRILGYHCPDDPASDGTILSESGKRLVGVWLMPDNVSAGILEHFVAGLIPDGDPLWPRAQQCVDSIPPEHREFKDAAQPKAAIHTWLAWREEPGVRMGSAIGRKYLDPRSPLATKMVEWIRRMLDQKPSFQTQPSVLG